VPTPLLFEVVKEQVLMIVKTYPTPSGKYGELVCTAGIRLRDNAWIRIYPYPFRLVDFDYQFKKYDIIEISLYKAKDDKRPESYKPYDMNSIRRVEHLKVDDYWLKRMPYIRATALPSVKALQEAMLSEDKTWGSTIRPIPVHSENVKVSFEQQGADWPEEDLKLEMAKQRQSMYLFAEKSPKDFFRTLRRVPYKMRLTFTDLAEDEHTFPILDWEIAQLYFNSRKKSKNDEEALEKVRYKIEQPIFSKNREVFLVIGNYHHRYKNRWQLAVDGFIWPKRFAPPEQPFLFSG
jgi:hypothetical protein